MTEEEYKDRLRKLALEERSRRSESLKALWFAAGLLTGLAASAVGIAAALAQGGFPH